MLTREDDIDVHALRRQGWTISAIARHLGRDRKTISAYLAGRQAGVRAPRSLLDPFEVFAPYCAQRLADDPHLWATTLFDELIDLGYGGSYPTMTRQLRARGLRPCCEACRPAKGRPIAVIAHPPGEETQWDWVELPDPPPSWGWGKNAHLLVGALSHSSRWRGVLCESEDQAHLIDGLDRISRALGGVSRDWRFDRMASVISPGTGRVSASFAAVAKHYGVTVRPCPPRRGNRKGVVEKANDVAAQRFWRTLADDATVEGAQVGLDAWCGRHGDARIRSTPEGKTTVGVLAAAEPLRPVPAPFPATLSVARTVSAQALVSFRGNRYSVPPELTGARVVLTMRLGAATLDIATAPGAATGARGGIVLARHQMAPTGAGAMVRDHGHVQALEAAAMAASTFAAPHRGKERRPPSKTALDLAAHLPGAGQAPTQAISQDNQGGPVVVDLGVYAAAAAGRNTLPRTPPPPPPVQGDMKTP
jgi:transposase